MIHHISEGINKNLFHLNKTTVPYLQGTVVSPFSYILNWN